MCSAFSIWRDCWLISACPDLITSTSTQAMQMWQQSMLQRTSCMESMRMWVRDLSDSTAEHHALVSISISISIYIINSSLDILLSHTTDRAMKSVTANIVFISRTLIASSFACIIYHDERVCCASYFELKNMHSCQSILLLFWRLMCNSLLQSFVQWHHLLQSEHMAISLCTLWRSVQWRRWCPVSSWDIINS